MTSPFEARPIGTPGVPWSPEDVASWRAMQRRQRSHADDVIAPAQAIAQQAHSTLELISYGELDARAGGHRLVALRSRDWRAGRPAVLVTGGVHGYETSGVLGALAYARDHAGEDGLSVNLLIAPCVSPWGWEHIHRWNIDAVDPNRSFREPSPSPEAAALMRLVARHENLNGEPFVAHVDLHETTDSDETEFRPALAARDGKPFEPGQIPDGFYLVDDTVHPEPDFQRAIIAAVSRVTHIAPADAQGCIIGTPVVDSGVIRYDFAAMGLCPAVSGARYRTTTEVYPDSARTSASECVAAQVAAVRAAVAFVRAASAR